MTATDKLMSGKVKPDPPTAPIIGTIGGEAIAVEGNPFTPPEPRDTPPRGNAQANPANPPKRKYRKRKPTDDQIREVLSEILTAPAVPYSMFRMDWPAQHVLRTGPEFADAMVAYSKSNEWLRAKLEAVASGDNALGIMIAVFALATAGSNYIIPQLAYFGVVPRGLGSSLAGAPIPFPPGPVNHGPIPPQDHPAERTESPTGPTAPTFPGPFGGVNGA